MRVRDVRVDVRVCVRVRAGVRAGVRVDVRVDVRGGGGERTRKARIVGRAFSMLPFWLPFTMACPSCH